MRFAFNINAPVSSLQTVELYDAAEASNAKPRLLATLCFGLDGKRYVYSNLVIAGSISKADHLTIRKLARVFETAEAESEVASPLFVCRALLAERNVQVAYDATTKRFRCVGTMKEGANLYELVGTNLTVEAKDEDHAVRLGKREVTEQMQENPESAGKLVAFFTGGCKVKQLVSGKLPEFIAVASLAQGKDEIAAAEKPIKLRAPVKDEDKE